MIKGNEIFGGLFILLLVCLLTFGLAGAIFVGFTILLKILLNIIFAYFGFKLITFQIAFTIMLLLWVFGFAWCAEGRVHQ